MCLSLSRSARILISATKLFNSSSSNLIQNFFTKVAQQESVKFRENPLRDRTLLEVRRAAVFTRIVHISWRIWGAAVHKIYKDLFSE